MVQEHCSGGGLPDSHVWQTRWAALAEADSQCGLDHYMPNYDAEAQGLVYDILGHGSGVTAVNPTDFLHESPVARLVTDCAFGVLTALAIALPKIDVEFGPRVSFWYFQLFWSIWCRASGTASSCDGINKTSNSTACVSMPSRAWSLFGIHVADQLSKGWVWRSTRMLPNFRLWPLFLSVAGDAAHGIIPCGATRLNFAVRDVEPGGGWWPFKDAPSRPPLGRAHGYLSTGSWVAALLRASSCHAQNKNADFTLLAWSEFAGARIRKSYAHDGDDKAGGGHANLVASAIATDADWPEVRARLSKILRVHAGPLKSRKNPAKPSSNAKNAAEHKTGTMDGRDTLLVLSAELWPLRAREQFPGRLLVVEGSPLVCGSGRVCYHCRSCFDESRDIVIPSFVDDWRLSRLRRLRRPWAQRKFLLSYHGRGWGSIMQGDVDAARFTGWAQNLSNPTRVALRALYTMQLPNVSIGPPLAFAVDDIHGNSKFCLVPNGIGSWTHRLYEVIFSGCVPVILSDDVRLPFPALVEWKFWSVKWPQDNLSPGDLAILYEWLLTLDSSVGEAMAFLMKRDECWLDWLSTSECSALAALAKTLDEPPPGADQAAGTHGHKKLPEFWNIPR